MPDIKTLNLYPIDYPFETLVSRSNTNPPKLILNPDFQRKYKWDKEGNERGSKFIESCLMRIPLPACYFAENEKGNHDVIDGVQRITTIKRFFNDEFKLEGLTVFKELNNKYFSELGEFRSELESTTIRCIILRKENPKELTKEIFARLNQGAVQLSPQEIRHAIFPGSLDILLTELSKIDYVNTFGNGVSGVTEKDSREPEEMVLRFFALQTNLSDYEDKLSKYLDNYMEANQNLPKEDIDVLKESFTSTLEKCLYVFEDNPFVDTTKSKKRQSLVYYDLLMWSFKDLDLEFLKKNKSEVIIKFNELCNDSKFTKSLSGGTQLKSSILKRRELWKEKLSTLL
ncbi:DUF262 domain-containing protein [Siphonobacter sp. SORGH_AS_0500]|uniref:DUF262 domain-containing protein n=1 Tax=Siphonobacter sp. SORGH_AS_0500 TaxID=1864824 RepID=UPI0028559B11|nr:DUF262 domain-containing protein [Siphonobacter sp. SORGH_AS_0500]MDR6195959.1 hypothetical protein [Siphonobacter sp. SORGH_AS_0500]